MLKVLFFCNLLLTMQNCLNCLEYTEISILNSVFVTVIERLKDSYFASIVSINQSHLVSLSKQVSLRTCYFWERKVLWKFDVFVLQKTCGPDCLTGAELNCSSLLSQHKSNQDKQRADSLVKMLILFISFSASDSCLFAKTWIHRRTDFNCLLRFK